jgi:hypothetical protein
MGSCASEKPVERLLPDTPQSRLQLSELPVEIHEAILDHLFGVRASTSSSMANGSQATRAGVMFSDIRDASNCRIWRLSLSGGDWFRKDYIVTVSHTLMTTSALHILTVYQWIVKVKGTKVGLHQCGNGFFSTAISSHT